MKILSRNVFSYQTYLKNGYSMEISGTKMNIICNTVSRHTLEMGIIENYCPLAYLKNGIIEEYCPKYNFSPAKSLQ